MININIMLLVVVGLSLMFASRPTTADGNTNNNINDVQGKRDGKLGLDSARSVLADIAREMVTRSATNSQVLSLNLTNLLILVVLKVVVFGAGMFGFNFLNKGGIRRSEDDQLMSEPELLLLLSYVMGDAYHNYECFHRVACEQPRKAKEYVMGAKMLMKGAKFFNNVIVYNPRYEGIVSDLQRAIDFGLEGGDCDTQFKCNKNKR